MTPFAEIRPVLRPALGGFLTALVTARRPAAAILTALALAAPAAPALAQSSGSRSGGGGGGGLHGWGPHFGLAADPDQLVLGVHFDVGRFAPRVRFQPDVELGLGDDHTIFAFTLPAHYLFRSRSDMAPYAGGGMMIGLDDRDAGAGNGDSDVEAGIVFTGGLEWRTGGGDRFSLELNLIAGDLHDLQLVAGFTF